MDARAVEPNRAGYRAVSVSQDRRVTLASAQDGLNRPLGEGAPGDVDAIVDVRRCAGRKRTGSVRQFEWFAWSAERLVERCAKDRPAPAYVSHASWKQSDARPAG